MSQTKRGTLKQENKFTNLQFVLLEISHTRRRARPELLQRLCDTFGEENENFIK